jgi:protein-disulfide reductase (glutathione)
LLAALAASSCNTSPGEVPPHRTPDPPLDTSPAPPPATTTSAKAPSGAAAQPTTGRESWNSGEVDWQPFDTGLRRAREQNKPVCLVLYTEWCPHCRNYSRVFDDPRIVERARDFVMVRVDADAHGEIASKYAPDGGYIPRTFFLGPDGEIDTTLRLPRPRYRYFYDERDPSSLLVAMEAAHHKLGH